MNKSTILVSPRERFPSDIPSLLAIFNIVDEAVPVILVEGGGPDTVRDELATLMFWGDVGKKVNIYSPVSR